MVIKPHSFIRSSSGTLATKARASRAALPGDKGGGFLLVRIPAIFLACVNLKLVHQAFGRVRSVAMIIIERVFTPNEKLSDGRSARSSQASGSALGKD